MPSKLVDRHRSKVSKSGDNIGGATSAPQKSCEHCNCSGDIPKKYRPKRGIGTSALLNRSIPLVLLLYGTIVVFRSRSQLLSPHLSPLAAQSSKKKDAVGNCKLRKYPKPRYYGLNDRPLPSFLDAEYIYGELPRILRPTEVLQHQNPPPTMAKLCVDQSEWLDPKRTIDSELSVPSLPFADGTNPSILKLPNNPRIDPSVRELLGTIGGGAAYYLATICMTNSQCSWNDSPQEVAEFRLSKDKNPSTVRTVLLVMDKNFETLKEATIYTKLDAPFGKRRKFNHKKIAHQLDDARLFTHKGQIWVSYREGKLFGYDKQVLNKVHFELTPGGSPTSSGVTETNGLRKNNDDKQLTVTLLASDTETLCCGRNMALIDNVHTDKLQALTWVDPVTVVDVDTSKTDAAAQQQRRRLAEEKKSHFHGTNGFMVHLPKTGEYLGIGHFHRPPGRDQNEHARFGHHYTHAFFTITDQPPFRLKRLSTELVLSSYSYPDDAEIIQFWSGLELTTGVDGKEGTALALAYGINDCEGAAVHLDLSFVEGLLRNVPEGKEVVDFMMPLK